MYKKYEIIPYTKVGEIGFNMSRESARNLLGRFKEFRKNKFSRNTTDDFDVFHVYYDQDNKVEAAEFFGGVELVFNERNLLEMDYNELIQFVKSNSFACREGDSGIIVNDIGISAYAPEKTRIESILVYRRGYYDFLSGDSL
jgi:hypothetical protein